MDKVKKIVVFLLFFIVFLSYKNVAQAVQFDLIPPSGDLERGQDVQFEINIDSQGETVNLADIGITYDTSVLEYINTVPGAAMTSVSVDDLGGGKLLFSGNNTAGFSGQGVFATVTFKIIAASSGSTELCVLWAPTPTPTNAQSPTSAPIPTALPATGNTENARLASIIGLLLLSITAGFYFFNRKIV